MFFNSHQRLSHHLCNDWDFYNYSLREYPMTKLDYKGATIWIWHHKEKGYACKVQRHFVGSFYLHLCLPYLGATLEQVREEAIALYDYYLDTEENIKAIARCPGWLEPVYDDTGYFIDNDKTDRRVLLWYFLNLGLVGQLDGEVKTWFSIEKTRRLTIRLRLQILDLGFGFNTIRIKPDVEIPYSLYYLYGLCYGVQGGQLDSLADDCPF